MSARARWRRGGGPGLWLLASLLCACPGIGWLACSGEVPPPADAIVRIGEGDLLYPQFEGFLEAQVGDSVDSLDSVVLSRLLDQFLDETLLFRHALGEGLIDEGAERLDALTELMAAASIDSPADAEVEQFYLGNPDRFRRPEGVRLRQLLVDDRALADQAATELAAGADFAEVARRYSEDPSGPYGGDQGVLAYEDLPELFAAAIVDLQATEVSELVETEYGFHLFQVLERLPASHIPLNQVAGEIRQRLTEDRAATYLDELVGRVRRRYNVEIYTQNLPFDYRGSYRAANGSSL